MKAGENGKKMEADENGKKMEASPYGWPSKQREKSEGQTDE